jgi:hypothetical protein
MFEPFTRKEFVVPTERGSQYHRPFARLRHTRSTCRLLRGEGFVLLQCQLPHAPAREVHAAHSRRSDVVRGSGCGTQAVCGSIRRLTSDIPSWTNWRRWDQWTAFPAGSRGLGSHGLLPLFEAPVEGSAQVTAATKVPSSRQCWSNARSRHPRAPWIPAVSCSEP